MLRKTISGITLTLVLIGLFSNLSELSIVCTVSEHHQFAAYPTFAYDNVTTHEGDLIINGTQVFVIENCTFIQTGSIYVRDSAKLVVRNATFQMNQTYIPQYQFVVDDYGTLELEDTCLRSDQLAESFLLQYSKASLRNVSLVGNAYLNFGDFSKATIHKLTWTSFIHLSGHCNVSFEDSRIFGMKIFEETCNVKLSDSYIEYCLWLGFSRGSVVGVDNLKPGFFEYLDLKEKALVYGMSLNVTLNKTFVNSWGISVYCDSETAISNSEIGCIGIWVDGLSIHFEDLKPKFYQFLRAGQITLNKTEIKFIEFTILEGSDVTITNSTIGIVDVGQDYSDVYLINSTVYSLKAWDFFGSLCFEGTTLKKVELMMYSDFYIYGNVSLEEFGQVWFSSNVRRNYGVIVKNLHNESVPNTSLVLLSEEDVMIWNGTTDNRGEADFNLTFTDGNYTDILRLEAVKGNYSASMNVSFLSSTPIFLTVPWTPLRHDISVAEVKLLLTQVYVGQMVNITAAIWNEGKETETFDVTCYYEGFPIGTVSVLNLTSWEQKTLTFQWNTTDLIPCKNYTISVEAEPVAGETILENNRKTILVKVNMMGDINGDGSVNIVDIATIARRFGKWWPMLEYDRNCDLNLDDKISIIDIAMAARNFGKTCG